MKSLIKTLAVTILGATLVSTAAVAQNVNVNSQDQAQFNTYRTYTFRNLYTTDAAVEPRLAIAIDRNLQTRGWQEMQQGGDILITAVLAGNNDRGLYRNFYSTLDDLKWNALGVSASVDALPTRVTRAPAGTLILDMYDSHTGALLWRGSAADFLSDDAGSNQLKVDAAVTRMLSGLPFEDSAANYSTWMSGN